MAALRLMLTRELALVQGPPGTGKTFVGLKLMRVLLDNVVGRLSARAVVEVRAARAASRRAAGKRRRMLKSLASEHSNAMPARKTMRNCGCGVSAYKSGITQTGLQ